MALAPTPALIADLNQAFIDVYDEVWSGQVSENDFQQEPEQKKQQGAQIFSTKVATAIEKWLVAVQLLIVPGSLATAGAPTSHVNVNTGTIIKQ